MVHLIPKFNQLLCINTPLSSCHRDNNYTLCLKAHLLTSFLLNRKFASIPLHQAHSLPCILLPFQYYYYTSHHIPSPSLDNSHKPIHTYPSILPTPRHLPTQEAKFIFSIYFINFTSLLPFSSHFRIYYKNYPYSFSLLLFSTY